MKCPFYTMSIKVKVDNKLDGVGVTHEESICTCREK